MAENNLMAGELGNSSTTGDPFQEWLEKRRGPKVLRPFKHALNYLWTLAEKKEPEIITPLEVVNGFFAKTNKIVTNEAGVEVEHHRHGYIMYRPLGKQITLEIFETFLGGALYTIFVYLDRPLIWDPPLETLALSSKEQDDLKIAVASAAELWEAHPIFRERTRKTLSQKQAEAEAYFARCEALGRQIQSRMDAKEKI